MAVENGVVGENVIAEAVAKALSTTIVGLSDMEFENETIEHLPEETARRFLFLPLAASSEKDSLQVAFADPMDPKALETARSAIESEIHPMVATVTDILTAINRVYGHEPLKRIPTGLELPTEITRRVESREVSSTTNGLNFDDPKS